MLLQFSVTNHRSIKDTAIISLKASTDKSLVDCLISPDEKKQLVPVLALYGANAAGKSNVLHALLLMGNFLWPICQGAEVRTASAVTVCFHRPTYTADQL